MLNYFTLFRNLWRHFSGYNTFGILLSLFFLRTKVAIPSRKLSIHLRKNSTDKETFVEIFQDNLYGILLPFHVGRIIDAGANTGIASIFFKVKYRHAKIAAIEIEESNVAMIRKNLANPDFTIYHRALYNKTAFFKIENPYHANNSFVVKEVPEGSPYDVKSITIDEIIEEQKWEMVDILKIDIEGAEKALFESGYQTWLPKTRVVMIETHDRMVPGCAYAVIKAMKEFDFTLYTAVEGTLIFYSREIMNLHV